MVLRHRENKMASEQPLKKKLRRGNNSESQDETDFIHNLTESGVRTDLSALHLSLPPTINEDDLTLNSVNSQFHSSEKISAYRTSDDINNSLSDNEKEDSSSSGASSTSQDINICDDISIQPAPNIAFVTPIDDVNMTQIEDAEEETPQDESFISYLVKQCLCEIPDNILHKPFQGFYTNTRILSEWSAPELLTFLSNLQLLFDIYLKQNNSGHICTKIATICDSLAHNELNLVEQIISLCDTRDKCVNYIASKVLSSFLIIAKTNINHEWIETIVNFLTLENIDYVKMSFSLEIIKRVVEWKNVDTHVLEEPQSQDVPGSSSQNNDININCVTITYSDAESYDTSQIKGLLIKSLEAKWPELITKIQYLITHNSSQIPAQTCVLTFLALWESTISVKANLSVVDTKPFYAHLEYFVRMLDSNLSPIVWKQLLSLFNEVLCYGSTLALQDMLPEDTCRLAHLIVRFVKDFRLLDNLPFRRSEGYTVHSFVGTINSTQPSQSNIDKTLIQKMTLLVLKSVAITVKETRSDSSDSSVGSEDYDFSQDMQLIARSIGDVLRKLDTFIKTSLEFHPETQFSENLVRLFSDQDDYMIESMVCTLDITTGISYQNVLSPYDFIPMLNPVHSFIEFLKVVSRDSDVLLDYLVSNETCFLLYLLRFLKYIKRNWDKFVSSCYEGRSTRADELDNTMGVLIRLRLQIDRLVSKDLFPYNINPILRLLEICENLYDGNEYS